MLAYNPSTRIRLKDILCHSWLNGETSCLERRKEEFMRRGKLVFGQSMLKEPVKSLMIVETGKLNGIIYKADLSKKVIPDMRILDKFSDAVARLCGLVSKKKPIELMMLITCTIAKLFPNVKSIKESKSRFSGKAVIIGLYNEFVLKWMIEQMKDGKHFIVFNKISGCKIEFLDAYRKIEEALLPQFT
jgi:flagellar biosynthesis protein FliQ